MRHPLSALVLLWMFAAPVLAAPELGRGTAAGQVPARGALHAASLRSSSQLSSLQVRAEHGTAQATPEPTAAAQVAQELRVLMRSILGAGLLSASILEMAAGNEAWGREHDHELTGTVKELRHALADMERLAVSWQAFSSTQAAEPTSVPDAEKEQGVVPTEAADGMQSAQQTPPPIQRPQHADAVHFVGLVIFAIVFLCARGRRTFDLFSPHVVSRTEVGLAFAVVSLFLYSIWDDRRNDDLENKPVQLFLLQLLMCFLGTVGTVPVVAGCRRDSPRWLVLLSQGVLLYLIFSWIYLDPVVMIVIWRGEVFDRALPAMMVTILLLCLFVVSWQKVLVAFGYTRFCLTPFYEQHERCCRQYLRSRVAGKSGSQDVVELPTYVPTAVLMGVFSTFTFALVIFYRWMTAINDTIPAQREQLLLLQEILEPILALYDLKFPMLFQIVDSFLRRVQACCILGIVAAFLYTVWLLRKVVTGYHQLFTKMVLGKPYKGHSQVQGPKGARNFHAQWATYFVGNLFGNTIVGFIVVGLLVTLLSLLLTTFQFWIFFEQRYLHYFTTPALIYVTKRLIFRFVIPPYVYTHEGVILRPRVWAFLYPTLTLLNFILGTLNGIIRFVVMLPLILKDLFRLDLTFMHEEWVEWDWSYHAFVTMVLNASKQLNPVVCGAAYELFGSVKQRNDNPDADSIFDDRGGFFDYAAERSVVDGHDLTLGRGSSGDQEMREVLSGARGASDAVPGSPPISDSTKRAQKRWQLAKILALNPSLRKFRKH